MTAWLNRENITMDSDIFARKRRMEIKWSAYCFLIHFLHFIVKSILYNLSLATHQCHMMEPSGIQEKPAPDKKRNEKPEWHGAGGWPLFFLISLAFLSPLYAAVSLNNGFTSQEITYPDWKPFHCGGISKPVTGSIWYMPFFCSGLPDIVLQNIRNGNRPA